MNNCCILVLLSVLTVSGFGMGARAGEKGLPPDLVKVEGGTFAMGNVFADNPAFDRKPDMMKETPVHDVTVGTFYLAAHETTVGEFREFAEATGFKTNAEKDNIVKATEKMIEQGLCKYPCWKEHWFKQTDREPVVWIAWEDAIAYCNWRSEKHGLPPAYNLETGQLLDAEGQVTKDPRQVKGIRLPTEAEWEYAARERGRKVRFGNGKDEAVASEINFNDKPGTEKEEAPCLPKPIGSYAPNALGLYDMSGNGWEWCTDTGLEYTAEPQDNPYALEKNEHLLRGGAYNYPVSTSRVFSRSNWWPGAACPASGFRIALTAE